MTRDEYISELRNRLHGLHEQEIDDAIQYCEECFEEIGDEEKALQELGSPAKFAAQLKADVAIKENVETQSRKKPRSTVQYFWMILGGIFALPIALPLLLVVLCLVLFLGILFIVLSFFGVAVVIACLIGAFLNFFMAFTHIGNSGQMILMIGMSLLSLGMGILCLYGVSMLLRIGIPNCVNSLSIFYQRHKRKGSKAYEER